MIKSTSALLCLLSLSSALSIEDLNFTINLKSGITEYSGRVGTDAKFISEVDSYVNFEYFDTDFKNFDTFNNSIELKTEWKTGFLPHFNFEYNNIEKNGNFNGSETYETDGTIIAYDYNYNINTYIKELNADIYYHLIATEDYAVNLGVSIKDISFGNEKQVVSKTNCLSDQNDINCELIADPNYSTEIHKLFPMIYVSGEVKLGDKFKLDGALRTLSYNGKRFENVLKEYEANLRYLASDNISIGAGVEIKEANALIEKEELIDLEGTSLYITTELKF